MKLRSSGGGDIRESRGGDRDRKVGLRWPDVGILRAEGMGAGDTPERPESELSFRSSNDPSIALAMQDEGEGRSSEVRSGNTQEDPGLGFPRLKTGIQVFRIGWRAGRKRGS